MCTKWFSSQWYVRRKQCTHLASRWALSLNGQKRASTWASSSRSTIGCVQNDSWAYGMFGTNRAPILHWHKHRLQTDRNKIQHDPCHLGVLLKASKTVCKPMVRSAQTMQLSCVKVSTISKQIKTSFHVSLVTLEYHRVHPKWFMTLLFVWRKPCTYLAPILTPSPNRPKQDST
jgi:hypothetical protein